MATRSGTPGSVMTYFPFPHIIRGRPGTGEVGHHRVLGARRARSGSGRSGSRPQRVGDIARSESFGEKRLSFRGPDGDGLALVEDASDERAPWTGGGVGDDEAIRGFHSASLRLRDAGATEELLQVHGLRAGRDA